MTTSSSPQPRRRGERGGLAPHVAVALVVVLLIGGLGAVALYRQPAQRTGATGTGEPVAAPSCRPGPGRPAPTVDLGVQPSTLTDLLPRSEVDRLVELAQQAGATVISTSTSWRFLQPTAGTAPADFRFAGVDRVVAAARARGLQVRLQLIGMPRWAVTDPSRPWSRNRPPLADAELAAWSSFVGTVAAHVAGDVSYLEVWNEPNGDTYWPTGPDTAALARLMQATYGAVKAAAPDLQVVTGGLVGNDIGYLQSFYQALDDLQVAPRPFDLVGVHPFTGAAAPDEVDPARVYERAPFGLFDENFTGYRQLHDVMVAAGDGDRDLYVTAFGYGTRANRGQAAVPDDVRAGYATQALMDVTCSRYVRAFSWYYLHPTPWDPAAWTLLDRRLRPNATYRAFEDWARDVAPAGDPTTTGTTTGTTTTG